MQSYRNQSIDLLCKLTGFYMMTTLTLNELNNKTHSGKININLSFDPFLANVSILYPLKTLKKLCFSGVFRGFKMETLARNALNQLKTRFSLTLLTTCISEIKINLNVCFHASLWYFRFFVGVNFSEDFAVVLNEWFLTGRCKACLSKTNTFGERQNFKGTLRFVMVSVICSRWFLLRPHEDAVGEVFLKTR